MKRVLIAGKDSYIGDQLMRQLDPLVFHCEVMDMRGNDWTKQSFADFDSVVLVAGIAHHRETDENRALYDQVNHQLAKKAAMKAKQDGVKQFVLFSSMSVYGMEVGRIHANTPTNPNTAYGQSKLDAENAITALADDTFHLAILRPPMIYGPGCKGNYPRLARLIRKIHVFPKVKNERSMLYINTLCMFMNVLLQNGSGGLYFPQNNEYVSTDSLAYAVAKVHHSFLCQPRGFAWLLRILGRNGGTIGKVFGTLTYDLAMSQAFMPEEQACFAATIAETEAAS